MSIYQHKSEEIAHYFASLPQVAAVALGGSQSSRMADPGSDLDLYIYTESQISSEKLIRIIEQCGGAVRSELNLPYWGGVNMWIDRSSGITVDCVYFDARWMEEQVSRVMDAYQPSLGYSTCFCRTVAQSQILYDRRA